jgi:phage gp36-like protein
LRYQKVFQQAVGLKKILSVLLLVFAFIFPVFAGIAYNAEKKIKPEVTMGYCTRADLEAAYGKDRIAGWSRTESKVVARAIQAASTEIDGYLISGGYVVPLSGPPENLRNYCVDIAAENLVISAGVLENDPGGKAVIDKAKNARQFFTKVAEGKFIIPGYANSKEVSSPPGGVLVSTMPQMDLKGY